MVNPGSINSPCSASRNSDRVPFSPKTRAKVRLGAKLEKPSAAFARYRCIRSPRGHASAPLNSQE